jgi:hypothetical protein
MPRPDTVSSQLSVNCPCYTVLREPAWILLLNKSKRSESQGESQRTRFHRQANSGGKVDTFLTRSTLGRLGTLNLSNRLTIEVHIANFRAVRGYTVIVALSDETSGEARRVLPDTVLA